MTRVPTMDQAKRAADAAAEFLRVLKENNVSGPVAVEVAGIRAEFGAVDKPAADGEGLASLQ